LNALSPGRRNFDRHVEAPTALALAYIAANLRHADRVECLAGRIYSGDQLAAEAVLVPGLSAVVYLGDYPAAVIGARPLWPGVWSMWAWGTDEWDAVALTLTRYALRTLKPTLLDRGAHRAECASWIGHEKAHRWLQFMGFECEGVMRGYGRAREDFMMFAWRVT
jgi:hypothetical protein